MAKLYINYCLFLIFTGAEMSKIKTLEMFHLLVDR